MKDSYYTSTGLANVLVSYVVKKDVSSVADFCIGGGELIRAALARFPEAECYGVDISKEAMSVLKDKYPTWNLDVCDFISGEERSKINLLCRKFDLILLNPPFTCKGSSINKIDYKGNLFHVSTAMMFLIYGLSYLDDSGEMLAIMPVGVIYSTKDKKIWAELCKDYEIKILNELEKQNFKECYPNVVLIKLKKGKTKELLIPISSICNKFGHEVEIVRGKLSLYLVSKCKGDLELIHTTSMRQNRLRSIGLRVSYPLSEILGPAVLIPRVGNPSIEKICLIGENEKYVLSDCIIGLKTREVNDSLKLYELITNDWNAFKSLYKGTGAKYITIERIKQYLSI